MKIFLSNDYFQGDKTFTTFFFQEALHSRYISRPEIIHPGVSEALQQHTFLDSYIDQWLQEHRLAGVNIYCRSGCSNCCSLAVHSTFKEAIEVANQLTLQQRERLGKHVEGIKELIHSYDNLRGYLKNYKNHVGACPFLDQQGRCSIYLIRPLSCRALLATRPADWCAVDLSSLDQWDQQLFEESLDVDIVAWPTHYVKSTQSYAGQLENTIEAEMMQQFGWTLSGNFAVLVWLECEYRISQSNFAANDIFDKMSEHRLNNPSILKLRRNGRQINL